jgi:hypothetical protein
MMETTEATTLRKKKRGKLGLNISEAKILCESAMSKRLKNG